MTLAATDQAFFPSDQYIAGFFDGEGSISLQNRPTTKTRHGRTVIRVGIANNNRRVLEHIASRFPGMVCGAGGGICFHFEIDDRDEVKTFLNSVMPYLIIKRNLAWIVLCFLEHGLKKWGGTDHPVPEDEWALRTIVTDLAKRINSKRGRDH